MLHGMKNRPFILCCSYAFIEELIKQRRQKKVSGFCSHLSIIQSHYTCKMCSRYPVRPVS